MKKYISMWSFIWRQLLGAGLLVGIILPWFNGIWSTSSILGEIRTILFLFSALVFLLGVCVAYSKMRTDIGYLVDVLALRNLFYGPIRPKRLANKSALIPIFGIWWYFFAPKIFEQIEEYNKKVKLRAELEALQEKFLNPNPYKLGDIETRTDPFAYACQMLNEKLTDANGIVNLVFHAEGLWRNIFFEVLEEFSKRYPVMVRRHASGQMFVLPTEPEIETKKEEVSDILGPKLDDVPVRLREAYLVLGYFNRTMKLLVDWDKTEEMLLKCLYDAQVPEEIDVAFLDF